MMRNHPQSTLPPGFRFHPTDEELILHYLKKRINSSPLPVSIIAEVDIYKFDPWDLPAIAAFGEKEWYFFTPRDRKYPNGARPNRAAASGYWKATGTDKTITTGTGGGGEQNVGVKKALVFYKGKPPKGTKTNWIMHEYRLAEALLTHHQNNHANKLKDSPMRLDDWVLCRIYKKSHASTPASASDQEQEEDEKFFQETLNLPSLIKSPSHNMTSLLPPKTSSFSNLLDAMDYSLLSSFLSDTTHLNPPGFESPHLLGALGNIEQPFFSNYNTSNNNNDYLIERLPDLSSASPTMENRVKRQNKSVNNEHDTSNVSKKMKYSDSFTNNNQSDLHMIQNNMAKQSFLNQHLLLSPFNLQFQL